MEIGQENEFSYTLDGYIEASEYLKKSGKYLGVNKQNLTGLELVEVANKLLKEENDLKRSWYRKMIKIFRERLRFKLTTVAKIS